MYSFSFVLMIFTMTSQSDLVWQNFYERQARGEIPYEHEYYVVDRPVQEGSASVQLVTPTEQQVQQARAAVKNNIKKRVIRPVKKRKSNTKRRKIQKGGKRRQPIKKQKKKKTVKRKLKLHK